MERPKLIGLVALSVMLGCGLFSAAHTKRVSAAEDLVLPAKRQAKTDLEVRWKSGGKAFLGYVSYQKLLTLPQVAATVVDDETFTALHAPKVQVTGVTLDVLAKTLKAPEELDLMLARCLDGYVGSFPTEYLARHHPILVLTVNGMTISEWAAKVGEPDLGPYMVTYDNFVPAWHVLAHQDRPQIPDEMIGLELKTQKDVFGPVTPAARFGPGSPERAGFEIAKQNCFRCHAAGPYGGTKAGLSWEALSMIAKSDRALFERYVHDPKSVSPGATMPENPKYDAATLAALSSYFRAMSLVEQ